MADIATLCPCCGSADLARSPAVLMPFVASRAFGWTPVQITPEWGLRSLNTGWAYPLCNSMQCQSCGFLFLDMRFSGAEMGRLYGGYRGEAYARERDAYEPGYAETNEAILACTYDTTPAERFLAAHVKPAPCVLDWGGDKGDNTPFFKSARQVDIYDISEQPVIEGARRVGLSDIAEARYDLVVLSHVLEHVPDPEAVVRPAAGALEADGVLYVEVPYEALVASAPAARDLAPRKRYWHEHVNFFTEDSLRALLDRCGLEVLALETRAFDSLANVSQVLSAACRRR